MVAELDEGNLEFCEFDEGNSFRELLDDLLIPVYAFFILGLALCFVNVDPDAGVQILGVHFARVNHGTGAA